MKTLQETINEWAKEFNERLEIAILNREFEKISEDKYTIKIKTLNETVDIWNFEENTYLYNIRIDRGDIVYTKNTKFKNEKACREILREETEEEIERKNREIEQEIERLKKLMRARKGYDDANNIK